MNPKLPKCFTFGLIGNIFFIIFSLVCLYYYDFFGSKGIIIYTIEAIAYANEALGFIFMILTVILLSRTVRQRHLMKISFSAYIIMELLLMIMELNSYRISFYAPYSIGLAIAHSVISAVVCFTFLSLDPKRTALEIVIVITAGIILFGMFGMVFHLRIYFSILMNAFAYIFMFSALKYLLSQQKIEIDCYGDKARVNQYKSTFFD